ncbi:MAG: response regulator [Pseudomonadota bacterium]
MHDQRTIRVVMAEDDFLVGKEIERTLKIKGYEVIGRATSGTQAIEMVKALQPDLVVMDIKMPQMDGLEATERIQQQCPTPVVILTAHETPDFLETASMAGAGAYLIKPPNPDELERAISIAMARHQDLMTMRRLLATIEVKNKELEKAMEEIKVLRGIIPICSFCKKIRDDEGVWEQLEKYISDHSEALFSHGVCPECCEKHYPELKIGRK